MKLKSMFFLPNQHVLMCGTFEDQIASLHFNPVDGHGVPVPHYGVVLSWEDWEALAEKLKAHGIKFIVEHYIRFKGQVGEQFTFFTNRA